MAARVGGGRLARLGRSLCLLAVCGGGCTDGGGEAGAGQGPPREKERAGAAEVRARKGAGKSRGIAAEVEAARARAAHPPPKPVAQEQADREPVDVETRAELEQAFRDAATEERLVLVDVHAVWCMPCKELEMVTLRAPEVEELLARHFVLVRIDVTNGDVDDTELQVLLDAKTLPALRVYGPTEEIVDAIAGGETTLPAAKVRIDTFVLPEELEGQLRAATR